MDGTAAADLLPIIKANVDPKTQVMTDEAGQYTGLKKTFAAHDFVRHGAGEYVVGDVHTNTVEGFYSVFKRGMKGVYQHCKAKHLHRYVTEFDFRYNNRIKLGVDDAQRTTVALRGIIGKRLTYRSADAHTTAGWRLTPTSQSYSLRPAARSRAAGFGRREAFLSVSDRPRDVARTV